jgi:predicted amidophosphoribosyltransferase
MFGIRLLRGIFNALAHVLWPLSCPVCGRLGVHVCRDCLESAVGEVPLFCLECGRDSPCGEHRGALVRAASVYAGASKELIRIMKYENGRSVAAMMGRLLAMRFGRPEADFLVPVPLHKSSERDYNQAEIIAREAGKIWRLDTPRALRWKLAIPRQAIRPGGDDRSLPEGAMTAVRDLRGARVFIVDDVYTSGSTMKAAVQALEKAGAAVTGAMVWCRAGGKGHGGAAF